MLYGLWKWGKKRNHVRLCNALAYYHAAPERWNMLPWLVPPGLTNNRFQSLVNGWYSGKKPVLRLGWISATPSGVDTDPNKYAIAFRFIPKTEVEVRFYDN